MVAPVKTRIGAATRVQQGDIFENVDLVRYAPLDAAQLEVTFVRFPWVVVLSQDCDLQQDFKTRWGRPALTNQDKYLLSVLVAPLYNASHVYLGTQLKELGLESQKIDPAKSPGKNLRNNQNPRYHYMELPPNLGLPALVVDFKHYFTADVAYLREKKLDDWVCCVGPLFREDLAHRFSAFLSRIGLP
jgi:hypothetical protein